MKKTKFLFFSIMIVFLSFSNKNAIKNAPYKNSTLPIEKRVDDLLNRMTTVEKIAQLDMYTGREIADVKRHDTEAYNEKKISAMLDSTGAGSVHDFYPLDVEIANKVQKYIHEKTRLGIPLLFIEEGLHGYSGKGSTSFPIPLQLASAFDSSMVRKIGRVIGTEARARGTEMILGPVLDLARDPRWGRVEETYGEDPYLDATYAVAMVKGMQGKSLDQHDAVISEPKHFAVHSVPEGGSNIAPVFVSEREARSTFFFPFEKAVREGGAMGIMAAYHELDGIPCVFNKWLLTDVLRKEWGFKGFVLSDLGAIKMAYNSHMTAKDTTDAMAQTLKAGLNMQFYDFDHTGLRKAVLKALNEKMLTESELNNAVRDILRVKFMLGLFENPYIDSTLQKTAFHTEASQQLALEAAQKSIVLLKNEGDILPVKKENARIALIGELAESNYPGGYSGPDKRSIPILDGLKARIKQGQTVQFEKGYNLVNFEPGLKEKAVSLVKQSDIAIVVVGENIREVGEGKDRSAISLDETQVDLIKAIYATGKPVAVVLFNGRPLTINWIAENIPAIVESWFSGEKGGLAIADILLGNVNPSGKLPITFPRSVGQIPFYYNHKPSSKHNYVDVGKTPLFAFGHGLSYTHFVYSDLKIQPEKIAFDAKATVQITVKNTGSFAGDEVVQLYVRDEIGSVTTPVKALKGYQRISLKPGENREVTLEVGSEALWLWNREMKRVVEPGAFTIMVGSSSEDIRLNGQLIVKDL
jgi:beta-glucosidase